MLLILLFVMVIIIGRVAARKASRAEGVYPANVKAKLRPLVLGSRILWGLAFTCLIPAIFEEILPVTGNNDGSLGRALAFAFCTLAFLCLGVLASLSTIADAWLRIRAARARSSAI